MIRGRSLHGDALRYPHGVGEAVSDTRLLLAVTVAAFVLFAYGLGVGTLWDQDEAKYTQVAREILGGDLFSLRVNDEPWFVHPPLFMWMQALTGYVFGFTEFTARIWSAVSGAGVVAVTFLLARLFYGARTGVLAAAILATTLQFLAQARLAVFDPTLLLFMLLALYMYLVAYTTGSRRAHLLAWMWTGWATATKGPIGLILPAMVVGALWVVRRDWSRWREIPLLGPVLFAVVGLPWYLIETVRHGGVFLRSAVGTYMFTRFFGVVENQPGPWWYYVPVLIVGAFPWTALLPSTVVYHVRRRHELASQVILLWVGITLGFYSVAGTKLPNYILPVYPLLAVGIARLCLDALEGASEDAPRLLRRGFGLLLVGVAFFVAGVVIFGLVKFPAQLAALRTELLLLVAVLAGGPIAALLASLARRPAVALAALTLTLVVAVPVLVHRTLPAIEQRRPLPRIARFLRDEMRSGDGLAGVRMNQSASLIYYTGRPVIWIEDQYQLGRTVCRHHRLYLVVPDAEYPWLAEHLPPGVRQQGHDNGYRILLKDAPTPCRGRSLP